MRISTRLLLAALVPTLMAAVSIGGVLSAYSPTVALQRRQAAVIQVRTDLSTLDGLARSYLRHHDDRSRQQFFAQVDEASQTLRGVSPGDATERRNISGMADDLHVMRSLFARIVANDTASPETPGPVLHEAEERLSAQLFIRSSTAAGLAGIVVQSLSGKIVRSQQHVSALITVFTIFAAAVLTAGLLSLRSGITRSLRSLQAGTEAVGGGDLTYRIGSTGQDELGELGRSFDTMTERLHGVTASKTELEREVEERKRAEEELAESLATTRVLLDAADALSTSIAPQDVLDSLVDVLSRATGRRRVLVSLYDAERDQAIIVNGGSDSLPEGMRFSIGALAPAARKLLEERRPLVIDYEAPEMPALNRQRAEALGYRLVLVVPLVRGDGVLGYLNIDDPGERREFTERDIEVARGIASQAAVAMENARLYEAERGVADRLQSALLALPDEIAGVEFAHAYHSASEAARVGGDFYDLFSLDEETVGITVGDVAGKGLDAAVLTSLTKNTIRAHANERGKTPAQILGLTNDVVFKSTPLESFVTVFFGALDLQDGTLTYANAGHTTGAIVRRDGSTDPLPSTAPLLGAFPHVDFGQESVCCLGKDEVLFLYTDGLTEARHDGRLFGEERVFDLLAGLKGARPADLVHGVIAEVLRFTGSRLNDDLALLAVKRLESKEQLPGRELGMQ